MKRFDGEPVGELGEGFDLGELLEAVRAAATPEEQVSANEAISVVTTRLRSNRLATPGTAVRGAASKGRRASTRLGAAIVVTVFTASASLAISGQLPPGARDVAAAFLGQMGLFPVPRLEASGQLATPHTTDEPFGSEGAPRDVWLHWMPRPQGDDRIHPPPVVDPTPVDPPPVVDPPPGDDPPPVVDPPPGDDPPPVVDPPPGDDPPPVVDPPPGDDPPPVVDPPPGDDPPPVVDPPPGDDPPPVVDPPSVDPPPGHGRRPATGRPSTRRRSTRQATGRPSTRRRSTRRQRAALRHAAGRPARQRAALRHAAGRPAGNGPPFDTPPVDPPPA